MSPAGEKLKDPVTPTSETVAGRPRVLLVDDDERNLLAVATVLEDLGEIILARSGEEALRHLLKGEFAVILLDVYMPGMDGYEAARIIRDRDHTKGIPIVFLSAVNKEAEHLLRGYAMGAVDYVFKPVDAIVLRSKVAVFVDLFAKTKEIERKAEEQRSLESQLVQAQKMDAIGKLTGGIAHDFNNLLAAVIGGLGLLERKASLTDEDVRILGMTKRAAEQGSELVRRLLAFARKQQLEPKPVSPGDLRDAVSDLLAHTLGGRVRLDWQVEDAGLTGFADQAQLELAMVNLIINARDAMEDGGTVTVQAEARTADEAAPDLAPGEYILLSVSDSGSGIPPEDLEQVLEPFFTTKEVGKGSGLGLPMVYGFAKQSNGAFRIESTVGRGTTAELWIPRAPDGRENDLPGTIPPSAAAPSRPLRILLVDDHPEVRMTTAAMLADLGHTVLEAEDGQAALDALSNGGGPWDMLISDYAMPHVSGTELVRRAQRMCPGMPALIITGYAEAGAVRDKPESVDVLLKPFTPAALTIAINRICDVAAR